MTRKRRVEIVHETERIYLVRERASQMTAWCAQCQRQVRLFRLDARQAMENSTLHLIETGDGLIFVCLPSLEEKEKNV